MNRLRIVIVGASAHGRVALDAARCQDRYEVVGWVDTFVARGTEIAELEVLGTPAELDDLARSHRIDGFFLAISDNVVRFQVYEMVRRLCADKEFVSILHPSATVARDALVGPGTLISAGAVVNTNCRLAEGCIVNTKSSLDHDCEMKRFASILPGVNTGGNVTIGEFACICLGANVAHKVVIGEHAVVGAGAVVLADIPPYGLAYGVPARVVRSRQAGEQHF